MKYIFFILIITSSVHAMENEVNKRNYSNIFGFVEKFEYKESEMYAASLINGHVIRANYFFKNGDIRVISEQQSSDNVRLLEDTSWYQHLKDLYKQQWEIK